ncbi:MAG: VIT domain-containing protein [Planctomycetota bacterium]|jgi:Ca-activated chloride channel family protein
MRLCTLLLLASATFAQGLVLPEGTRERDPIALGEHRVEAKIQDQLAAVTVEQTFRNKTGLQLEGTYLFPLPEGASVSDFAMTMGGKMVTGEILDADRARSIYRSIVQRSRDPGLLEYLGKGLFRARVFPIEPDGEIKIRLNYQQILPETGGATEFRYPLRNRMRAGSVLVDLQYQSSVDLKTVFCPSHSVSVERGGERTARVTYESSRRRPERNMVVYFGRNEDELGFSLLSHKPGAEDGTFLSVFAPKVAVRPDRAIPRDVLYILDRSGSMQGEKMRQAKRALQYGVGLLRKQDRFNLIAFASDWRHFKREFVPATDAARKQAGGWIARLDARGGTALEAALASGLRRGTKERLFLVVLLTDGRPTVGIKDPETILEQVKKANKFDARVFTFGVGEDLDVRLLDRIAEATRGARDYVAPDEEIATVTGRFFRKIDQPVLADLEVEFGEGVGQIYPRRLPDLFAGDQLILLGRYAKAGARTVRVSGTCGGGRMTYEFGVTFLDKEHSSYLPRLWAQRKVAFLLDEIRLHGPNKELVDEIRELGVRYSLVTPYTAGLVVDEHGRPNGGVPPGLRAPTDPEAPPPPPSDSGGASGPTTPGSPVFYSKELKKAKRDAVIRDSARIKAIADKTFRMDARGRWVDAAWDETTEPKVIEAFSDAYFDLIDKSEKIAKYLALGERVLFVFEGKPYEIVPEK